MGLGWRFFRAGGFDQVRIETGAELVSIGELDQKLWVALACPVKGLEFDPRTLDLLDTDRDGRVRAGELIAAVQWVGRMVADVESLARGSSSLPLAVIDRTTEEGQLVARTAETLLHSLGRDSADAIDVADTAAALTAFAARPYNGDGILPPDAIDDPATRAAASEVVACTPAPAADRGGRVGIDTETTAAFFAQIAAYVGWLDAGVSPAVRPLGPDTDAAWLALSAVRGKIDDFFVRVRLASFDPRAYEVVNRDLADWHAVAGKDRVDPKEVEQFPLAHVAPDRSLPLDSGLNPAWAARMASFRRIVVAPLLGAGTELAAADWDQLWARFDPYEAWLGTKAGATVEGLGEARIRALHGSSARAELDAQIARDVAAKPMADAIESVERLVRYHRDLIRLANNFVSFRDFYGRRQLATFQAGTLFLDQRSCSLCIRVHDADKHAVMAPLSKSYLLYCDLRNAAGEHMSIVAAMTNGDVDNLMVGRNGLFYDRQGRDWDATVTKIIENPISVRQAFWAPYKRLLRILEEQVAKRATVAEEASMTHVDSVAGHADSAATGKPPTEVKPFDVGTVAALGVAVGGITAALGALLQAFFGLGLWMPLGVVGLILLISGPSMAVAWLKLRQRNLGPLLDANGWAVNAQAKLNVPLGASLTAVAALPPGAHRDPTDPFAEKTRPWGVYVGAIAGFALVFGWYVGKLDPFLPGPAKSTEVLGSWAPASNPSVAAYIPAMPAALMPAPVPAPAPAAAP